VTGGSRPVARERRHTLHFLAEVRAVAPVFLDTEVDMTAVRAHRAAAGERDRRYSYVTYVLHESARVLATHPEANAAIRGGLWPRVVRYPSVTAKLALDKTMTGQRVVLAALLPDLERSGLDEIQRRIDHHRDGDPATMPEYAGARLLHRLPGPVGRWVYRTAVRPLGRRAAAVGSYAVTSLGHRAVDGFHSVGGTTVTLGLGRVVDRAVVRAGAVGIAPVMRLNLAFDHRVVDGAEAADILTELKERLEGFTGEQPGDRHHEPAGRSRSAAPAGSGAAG
jgi:pyruvate/2-oxoglutarate dehydrogenase complex dihydrolipoamide acyltransferase (E2) component